MQAVASLGVLAKEATIGKRQNRHSGDTATLNHWNYIFGVRKAPENLRRSMCRSFV